jgi:hypothetical protein
MKANPKKSKEERELTERAILEQVRGLPRGFHQCPNCGIGMYGGIFYRCCDNKECFLYDRFKMQKCYICEVVRRECTC